jgi:hypothetical protein
VEESYLAEHARQVMKITNEFQEWKNNELGNFTWSGLLMDSF